MDTRRSLAAAALVVVVSFGIILAPARPARADLLDEIRQKIEDVEVNGVKVGDVSSQLQTLLNALDADGVPMLAAVPAALEAGSPPQAVGTAVAELSRLSEPLQQLSPVIRKILEVMPPLPPGFDTTLTLDGIGRVRIRNRNAGGFDFRTSVCLFLDGPDGTGPMQAVLGISNDDPLCDVRPAHFVNPSGATTVFVDVTRDGHGYLHARLPLGGVPTFVAEEYVQLPGSGQYLRVRLTALDTNLTAYFQVGIEASADAEISAEAGVSATLAVTFSPARASEVVGGTLNALRIGLQRIPTSPPLEYQEAAMVLNEALLFLHRYSLENQDALGDFSVSVDVAGSIGLGVSDTTWPALSGGGGIALVLPNDAILSFGIDSLRAFIGAATTLAWDVQRLASAGLRGGLDGSSARAVAAHLARSWTPLGEALDDVGRAAGTAAERIRLEVVHSLDLAGEAGGAGGGGNAALASVNGLKATASFPIGRVLAAGLQPGFLEDTVTALTAFLGWMALQTDKLPEDAAPPDWLALANQILDDTRFSFATMAPLPTTLVQTTAEFNASVLLEVAKLYALDVRALLRAMMIAAGREQPSLQSLVETLGELQTQLAAVLEELRGNATFGIQLGGGGSVSIGAEATAELGAGAAFYARTNPELLLLFFNSDSPSAVGSAALGFDITVAAGGGVSLGEGVELSAEGGINQDTSVLRLEVEEWDGPLPATYAGTVDDTAPPVALITAPGGSIGEGQAVLLSGRDSHDNAGAVVGYLWTFGDGSAVATGRDVTHAWAENGSYAVTLTVVDAAGNRSEPATATVTVVNLPPAVTAGPNRTLDEGAPLGGVLATFADPGARDTHTATIDWGDGTSTPGSVTEHQGAGSVSGSHVYADSGAYTLRVCVRDDEGAAACRTLAATVRNVAPAITALAATPSPAAEGQAVAFTGAFTDPGAADTHTIRWDFGDGGSATGTLAPSHVYADNGSYTVALTVIDDEGGTATRSFTVTITNVAPAITALAATPSPAAEGQTVAFTGAFTDPGAADTHTIRWDFGDGGSATGTLAPSHVYADNGSYTVRLTVTDDDGGVATRTLALTVANVPPTVIAREGVTTDEGALVDLSGTTFSDPGFGDSHTASVDWGDGDAGPATVEVTSSGGPGAPRRGAVVASHVYRDNGTYTVRVCVSDDDSGQGCDSFVVVARNVPPALVIAGARSVDEGRELALDLSAPDRGAADRVTLAAAGLPPGATFEQTPGNPATGRLRWTPSFTQAGEWEGITLTATDDDGGIASERLTLAVGEAGQPVLAATSRKDGSVALLDLQLARVVNEGVVGRHLGAAGFFDISFGQDVAPARLYVAEDNAGPGAGPGAVRVLVGPVAPTPDTAGDFALAATVPAGVQPAGLALSPDGAEIWVAARNEDALIVLDRATDAVVATLVLRRQPPARGSAAEAAAEGRRPMALAFSPDGGLVWVAARNSNELVVVDRMTRTVLGRAEVGNKPAAVAADPARGLVYVANANGGDVSIVDVSAPARPVVVGVARVGGKPAALALSADSRKLWVLDPTSDALTVLRAVDGAPYLVPLGTVRVGRRPAALTVSPAGGFVGDEFVYVAIGEPDAVVVVDARTDQVLHVIPLDSEPEALAAGIIPTKAP